MRKLFMISALVSFFLGINLFFSSSLTHAETYAFYVDESYGMEGDGSRDKPFKKIGEAVKKAKAGDKIFIKKGQYDESFVVPGKVGIYGESRDGVVIKGMVTAGNGTMIENITVSGSNRAVLVDKDATLTISKSIIRDAARIGIDIPPGNGKIIVKNSKIYNNGKGFYIQSGNRFEMTNSAVYKNREEGIDLRDNNDGFIQGNEIYENGESGIEIILGKTDMVISGNSIRSNNAQGIAAQYYENFNDLGVLVVKKNTIKGNTEYGLKCNMPSGGKPSYDYWDKSMKLEDNVFNGNKSGDFSALCKLTLNAEEIRDIDEEKRQSLSAIEMAKQKELEELQKQKELEEAQRKLEEAIRHVGERESAIEAGFNDLESAIADKLRELEKKSFFAYLFRGPKKDVVGQVEADLNGSREKIAELRALSEQAPTEEIKGAIENKIISLDQSIMNSEHLLEKTKKDLSFWHRLKDLFKRP